MTTNFGVDWDTLRFRELSTGREIEDSVPVYSVRLINGSLWAGTNDGIAISSDFNDWKIIREFFAIPPEGKPEEKTYVSPSPFSPYLTGSGLKFHYLLDKGGTVTIRIYDFANNFITKLVDRTDHPPFSVSHVQYDDLVTWNGVNDKGDKVAAGVYIYLLESSNGDKYWGKFMVIP
jgi:hypothetical protein